MGSISSPAIRIGQHPSKHHLTETLPGRLASLARWALQDSAATPDGCHAAHGVVGELLPGHRNACGLLRQLVQPFGQPLALLFCHLLCRDLSGLDALMSVRDGAAGGSAHERSAGGVIHKTTRACVSMEQGRMQSCEMAGPQPVLRPSNEPGRSTSTWCCTV